MKDLKKLLFKSLAKQKIASVSRGAMVNKLLSNFVKTHFSLKQNFNGKIENNIYFVKSSNSSLSNMLFLNKKKVLDHINLKLKDMDLEEIKDIKLI